MKTPTKGSQPLNYDSAEGTQQMNNFQDTFSQKEIPKTAPLN